MGRCVVNRTDIKIFDITLNGMNSGYRETIKNTINTRMNTQLESKFPNICWDVKLVTEKLGMGDFHRLILFGNNNLTVTVPHKMIINQTVFFQPRAQLQ